MAKALIAKGSNKPPSQNYASRRIQENLAELCRPYVYKCVDYYVEVLTDSKQLTKDRLAAADKLLDRGFGRAVDMVVLSSIQGDTAGDPVRLTTEQLIAALSRTLPGDGEVLEHQPVAVGDIPPAST